MDLMRWYVYDGDPSPSRERFFFIDDVIWDMPTRAPHHDEKYWGSLENKVLGHDRNLYRSRLPGVENSCPEEQREFASSAVLQVVLQRCGLKLERSVILDGEKHGILK
jgi:hypothetical protein